MQEEEAIESVLEEFSLQKVNASDVVLVTDADQLREYVPLTMHHVPFKPLCPAKPYYKAAFDAGILPTCC